MSEVEWAGSSDPEVRRLLAAHPRVASHGASELALEFRQDGRRREVRAGDLGVELYGLVALADNNPLVCADLVSTPGPVAALASVLLGPPILGGVARGAPILLVSEGSPSELAEAREALARLGPGEGPRLSVDPARAARLAFGDAPAAPDVLSGHAVVEVDRGFTAGDAAELFDERFGRSFFVRRDLAGEAWRPEAAAGRPDVRYRVGLTPSVNGGSLVIEACGARSGVLGAAGLVHAMNVMAGLEESLGIAG